MRHRNAHRKLGRTSSHRKALLRNLAISIILHGKIETGLYKAKELRSFLEKLVTVAIRSDFNSHRFVFAALQNKQATKKLILEVAPKYVGRKGGYLSIRRSSIRRGDSSVQATLSFV